MSRKQAYNRKRPRDRAATKAETFEALLSAAMIEFGKHGFDSPSLDAICKRAGYTRGAFYVHFPTREALIAAVIDRASSMTATAMIASGNDAMDLEQTIAFFGEAVAMGHFPTKMGVRLHHVLDAFNRSALVRERQVAQFERVRTLLTNAARRGQAGGRIRDDIAAEMIAELLLVLVLGTDTMLSFTLRVDPRGGAAAIARMFAPTPAPSRRDPLGNASTS